MQKSNIVIIALVSINIILAVICGFFYIKKDRTEPKLAFTADNTVYTVGMDTSELITGMTAIDNKDGDISDRIVIEKILENKDKGVAVVYYAVCDYDGNVAKASREFPAKFELLASAQVSDSEISDSETEEVQSEESEEGEDAEADAQAAEEEALKAEEEARQAEEEAKAAEEAAKKAEEEAKAAEEAKKAEEEKNKSDEDKQKEEAARKAEEERKAAEAAAAAEAARKSASSPYIKLRYTECKVPIGGGVPWADAIETLKDDKDGYETLFRNLIASKFDNSKKGDYSVTLYTTDTDKNRSNTVTMVVHVQ